MFAGREDFADRDSGDTLGMLSDISDLLKGSNTAVSQLRRKTVPRVMMSGCVDLMHSGHVACFEEASKLGDLYMCLGSDKNIAQLKHKPTIPEEERRYMVAACRFVHEARISRGSGDLDWLTEVDDIKPDIFFVNEDGDRPAKREACARLGIKYVVGKREPAEGLDARSSTDLKLTVASQKATSAVEQPKQRPRLVYFNGRGKCDPVRFTLEAAGVEYDDVFLESREQLVALIDGNDLDFNQVPMLQLAEGNLVQVRAIIGFIAETYGLAGDGSPMQKYQLEEIYQGAQDMRRAAMDVPFNMLRGGKTLAELVDGVVHPHLIKWGSHFEAVVRRAGPSPFFGGLRMTYADVALFEAVLFLVEVIDAHKSLGPASLLADFPKLLKHFKAVYASPRIAAFLASPRRRPVPVGAEAMRYAKEVDMVLGR